MTELTKYCSGKPENPYEKILDNLGECWNFFPQYIYEEQSLGKNMFSYRFTFYKLYKTYCTLPSYQVYSEWFSGRKMSSSSNA